MKSSEKIFRVTGKFRMGGRWQKFAKEIVSTNPKEKIYSEFGSRHGTKRRDIKIENIKQIKKEELTDYVLKHVFEEEKNE